MSRNKEKRELRQGPSIRAQRQMLCNNLSFSAAEAYKLLRTNLLYSVLSESGGRVVGITSSARGEGKTTNSINLAYTLAETGAKVLLIDGDMRLPNVAKRLALNSKNGLSGLLAGLYNENKAIQESGILPNLMIMTSGTLPPNPAELLGSERMRLYIEQFRTQYDFVVIDLPPVNVVTDALVVSGLVDGMVVMVRQDYTDQRALSECVNSLQLVNAHILGFVMTDARDEGGKYGRYKYHYGRYRKYKKYGKYKEYSKYSKYGYYNGYGYANAAAEEKDERSESSEQKKETKAGK